ncbi:MAG: helix-turn-helix domain-containing protein [Hahellaceae bacterium]|jgi:DNA-binding transcriptional regulator YiaG|nr:helix-turn-helix domain-containing protein [Hahellaceae bacterium]
MKIPAPEEIRQVRRRAGLTQKQAAETLELHTRTWQKYEGGTVEIHPVMWAHFVHLVSQPGFKPASQRKRGTRREKPKKSVA